MDASRNAAPNYRQALLKAYEDEVAGVTYFAELGKRYHDPRAGRTLALVSELEKVTAAALQPVLDRHGITYRDTELLYDLGREEAQAQVEGSWPEFVAFMLRDYPPYVEAFRDMERIAPADDRPALHLLTLHEVAIVAFAELEAAGAEDSTWPLRQFLDAALPKR
ncbi:hypothetical protein [Mesorhizobium sp. KR1-2]|uniref:hypothetical protein n=1 Tax=Mesorhizobium sp. KR1-2 TaxID=3156609 RepID=UPI0032B5B783